MREHTGRSQPVRKSLGIYKIPFVSGTELARFNLLPGSRDESPNRAPTQSPPEIPEIARTIAVTDHLKLFVANFGSATVGEYDAKTGVAINASFITGLNNPVGLAVKIAK